MSNSIRHRLLPHTILPCAAPSLPALLLDEVRDTISSMARCHGSPHLPVLPLPSAIRYSVCKRQKLYLGEKENDSTDIICILLCLQGLSLGLYQPEAALTLQQKDLTLSFISFSNLLGEKSSPKSFFLPCTAGRGEPCCCEGWDAETSAKPQEHNMGREGKTSISLCPFTLQPQQSHSWLSPLLQLPQPTGISVLGSGLQVLLAI